jgi:pimeloyl-ACP methyl ester carboxylesterase
MGLAVALSLVQIAFGQSSFGGPAEALPRAGVVLVVGGVGGLDPLNLFAPLTLPRSGVRHELRNFPWTHGKCLILRDLQDTRYLLARAAELAEEIRKIKSAEPDRPVYLMGHSAGAAVSLAAAEQLPPCTLERIILLSAAVSPDYDLQQALRATRREIISFNSCCDVFMLGFGTWQFGTADRVYGPAAGRSGFRPPSDLDADGRCLYSRLVQVNWRPADLLMFRGGSHNSTCMPVFLATSVAPWLLP